MLPFLEKKNSSPQEASVSVKRQPDDKDAKQHSQIKSDLELAKALIDAALEAIQKEQK